MDLKSYRIGIILGFLCIFSIVSFLVLFFLFTSLTTSLRSNRGKETPVNFDLYLSVQLDLSSKSSLSKSFVSLPRKLNEGEHISYRSEVTKNYHIITRFEGNEYECTGICSCEKDDRRNSNVLSRGLYVLFSALTTSLAIQIAKEAFDDECVNKFSLICDPQHLVSEVTHCESTTNEEEHEFGVFQGEEWGEINYDENQHLPVHEWECTGHCVDNNDWFHFHEQFKDVAYNIYDMPPCESRQKSGFVETLSKDPLVARLKFSMYDFYVFCCHESEFVAEPLNCDVNKIDCDYVWSHACIGSRTEMPHYKEERAMLPREFFEKNLDNIKCLYHRQRRVWDFETFEEKSKSK